MRRTILLLAGVLLSLAVLGSDSPKEYDDKTEGVAIDGTWRLIEFEFKGEKVKPQLDGVLTYHAGVFTLSYNNVESIRGSYRIDTSQPAHLDWIPSGGALKGKTLLLIYQIDGDKLRLGFMNGGAWTRPQGFHADNVAFETYQRVKK